VQLRELEEELWAEYDACLEITNRLRCCPVIGQMAPVISFDWLDDARAVL
jgi:hypothetical protein